MYTIKVLITTDKKFSMERNYKILFVCLGNICRSSAAEGIMNKLIEENGLKEKISTDSAGLISYHEGELPDKRMIAHAARRGYNLTHLSRPVRAEDFEIFDLIIGMDDDNIKRLLRIAPSDAERGKIHKMTEYMLNRVATTVPDPYYGGASGFENVLDILEDACEGLLQSISTKL